MNIFKEFEEWEDDFNEKWFPQFWLVFVYLGDPSACDHPNIDELFHSV